MEQELDFTKCRPMKPPKSVQLASQPKRPIQHPDRYRHICDTCHFRYAKKSDLKLHLRTRHNPTLRQSARFGRESEVLGCCPLCHFRGGRMQLCDHFRNSHPLELIRLMFSDREQFVYLSSSYINTTYDRIIMYRLEREMGEVLRELVVAPVAPEVAQDLRPLVIWGRTQPEVAEWQKRELGTETETETIETFEGVKLKPLREPAGESGSEEAFVSEGHFVSCPFCITKFKTESGMKWHMRHKHWPTYKRRVFTDTTQRCEICGRRYLKTQYLATHLNHAHATHMRHLRHSKQSAERDFYWRYNRFHCDTCGDTFMDSHRYEQHLERGHVARKSVGLRNSDTKYRGVAQLFTREHRYLTAIQVLSSGTKLCRLDRWSHVAKNVLVSTDKVERYETIF